MTQRIVKTACPYCGFQQHQAVEAFDSSPQVVLCSCDEGGCDEYYIVQVRTEITATSLPIGTPEATYRDVSA